MLLGQIKVLVALHTCPHRFATLRQLATVIDCPTSTVDSRLLKLMSMGYVFRKDTSPNSYFITLKGKRFLSRLTSLVAA